MKKGLRLAIVTLITVTLAGVAMRLLHPIAKAAGDGVLLTGMVKSGQGEKMAGVTVSAKAAGSSVTTSVFTDADGNYYFPRLASGQYRVWSQAVGYDGSRMELQMMGSVQHQSFTLKTLDDFSMQLTGDQWLAALPEDSREDRRMKEVLRLDCVGCHSPAFPLQNRFDEKGWASIITLMSRETGAGRPPMGLDQPPMPAVNYFKPELAAYLAKMRGPGASPMKFKARPRPTGEAALAVVTEYDVPLPEGGYPEHDGSDWSFGTPAKTGDVHDAQIDFNGNLWFTDWSPNMTRTIGKIDGKTGVVKDFKVPGPNGFAAATHAIVRDESGTLWFNVKTGDNINTGHLARLDPNTEKIEVFSPPSGMPSVGDFLDWDGKGNIWVAAGGGESRLGMLRFEPKTQKFTFYKSDISSGTDAGNAGIYGVTGDSEGNGWSSRYSSDLESKADYETGKVEEVQLPKRPDEGLFTDKERKVFAMEGESSFSWGVPWGQGPRRPGGDKHGDAVWVPGWWSHNLMKIDIHTSKVIKEYPMPLADGGSYMAQVDKDHVVWVNYQNSGTISKFDPKNEKWIIYTLPSLGLETHQIGVFDHDGPTQIAVADERNSKIDRVQFRTQAQVNALRAEDQETASNR